LNAIGSLTMDEPRHTTVLDTGLQHLGMVYARALLGAAEKAGQTDAVLDELQSLVRDVLDRLPHFEAALASPRVPFEAKEQLLDRAFRGRMNPVLLNFAKILALRGRFDTIRPVQSAARRLLNELRNLVEVRVVSAEPLDRTTRDMIASRLAGLLGRNVDVHPQVDPELVGGMVIRIGDTVYDGSIANQLRRRSDLVARATQTMRTNPERLAIAK
jgi:F-type H+-transporting ATPase subunit delta